MRNRSINTLAGVKEYLKGHISGLSDETWNCGVCVFFHFFSPSHSVLQFSFGFHGTDLQRVEMRCIETRWDTLYVMVARQVGASFHASIFKALSI